VVENISAIFALNAAYRSARREMQEYLRAKQNVELFYQEQAERLSKNRMAEWTEKR
jgi:hypothetical protein